MAGAGWPCRLQKRNRAKSTTFSRRKAPSIQQWRSALCINDAVQNERALFPHLHDFSILFDDPPLSSIGSHAHVYRPFQFILYVDRRKHLDRVSVERVLVTKGRGGKSLQQRRQGRPKLRAVKNPDGGKAEYRGVFRPSEMPKVKKFGTDFKASTA